MPLDLSGLMVAQVTPFSEDGAGVDLDWLPAHIAWLHGQGVSSILTLGTNGEGPSVGLDERRRVVEAVVAQRDALGGSLGVVAGAAASPCRTRSAPPTTPSTPGRTPSRCCPPTSTTTPMRPGSCTTSAA